MCILYLPVQWVYEVLGSLWAPHGVEHYKIAAIYAKYEQNPMITAYIDTKSIYTSILDLHLFRNIKEV